MRKSISQATIFDSKKADPDGHLERLFKPHKTIRDAVHGDIMLTELEVRIIDTECFQRLRGLRQLGTTHLVYPCAMHTRFDHAIGCLHVAEKLVRLVNSNPYPDIKIDHYDHLLIRLSALLHDLAHIPFGHTIEDEGGLLMSQWKDAERTERFLGDKSEVAQIIRTSESLQRMSNSGATQYEPIMVLRDLRATIQAIEEHTVEGLVRPFIGDIIGNTLCADLLDYIRRDLYFCGLEEGYDDRFLSYLYVTTYNGKPRLVLRLHKPSTKKIRRDVQSELLHLLRLRYSLAEKVYFHHAKISSSAMIISAVTDMFHREKIDKSRLYSMSDDSLLEYMKNEGTSIAKRLTSNLSRHKLFKPVYGLRFGGESGEDPVYSDKETLRKRLAKKEVRWQAERSLEKQNDLPEGSVVIYCPGEGMGYKAVKALVNIDGHIIGPLDEKAPSRVAEEIRSSITQKHKELWCMYVFVDPDIDDSVKTLVHGDCQIMFRLQSDVEDCRPFFNPSHVHYLLRFEDRLTGQHPELTHLDHDSVLGIAARVNIPAVSDDLSSVISLSFDEYSRIRLA